MCFLSRAMVVASLTFLLAAGSALAVSKRTYREWSKVARCEADGGWHVLGSAYPDSLGITATNWIYFGRLALGYAPKPQPYTGIHRQVPMRLRRQAIRVAVELHRDTGARIPDQHDTCYSW